MWIRHSLLVLAVASLGAPSFARDRVAIGVSLGAFYPAQKKVRDALGSQWLAIGIAPVDVNPDAKVEFSSDFQVLTRRKSGNRLLLINPSYGVTLRLSEDREAKAAPYFSARTGPVYMDYAIGSGATRVSRRELGWGANAEVGIKFNKAAKAFVRYDTMTRSRGFQFDGVSVGLEVGVGRL